MRNYNIAALAATVMLLGASALPVQAKSLQSYIRDLSGRSSAGISNSAVANVALNNFAVRQDQLRTQINSAVSVGQLSPGTAQSLISMLDQISSTQSSYMGDGVLSTAEMNDINSAFTNVTTQLTASLNTGYNTGYTTGYNYNQYANPYVRNYSNQYVSPYTSQYSQSYVSPYSSQYVSPYVTPYTYPATTYPTTTGSSRPWWYY